MKLDKFIGKNHTQITYINFFENTLLADDVIKSTALRGIITLFRTDERSISTYHLSNLRLDAILNKIINEYNVPFFISCSYKRVCRQEIFCIYKKNGVIWCDMIKSTRLDDMPSYISEQIKIYKLMRIV